MDLVSRLATILQMVYAICTSSTAVAVRALSYSPFPVGFPPLSACTVAACTAGGAASFKLCSMAV